MLTLSTRVLSACAAGVAAVLFLAPVAGAQPPAQCAPDDQQCQDQQKGSEIANGVIDNVQDGVDKAQEANDALNPNRDSGGIGVMARVNGVLTCVKLGQPLPPGATFESPTGNGVSSYC